MAFHATIICLNLQKVLLEMLILPAVCNRGCHFVYKLKWGPRHKATKLPLFPLIGCSNQIFPAILIGSFGLWLAPLTKKIVVIHTPSSMVECRR